MNLSQKAIIQETIITKDDENIEIDKYQFEFEAWQNHHTFDTYGGKQILQFENEPVFAELLMLRLLERQGFKGVWVDTYRNKFWQRLPQFSFPVLPDNKILDVYHLIYAKKGGRKAGCFDIIAYKENHFVFVELKKEKEDKIRPSQIKWLQSAIQLDLENSTFMIAEWKIK